MAGLVAVLGLLSLLVFVVGLVALARGHLDWVRIRSRGRAGAVTGVALVVLVVCSALNPDDAGKAAVNAAPLASTASPSVEPTQSPSASPAVVASPAVAASPSVPSVPTSPTVMPTTVTTSTAVATPSAAVASSPRWPRSTSPAAQAAVGGPYATPVPATAAPRPAAPPPPPAPRVDPRAGCDPSYPDVCLRDGVGDYDCEGGSGNGPNYVHGPLRVLQPDPFRLDGNHDGTGCEAD